MNGNKKTVISPIIFFIFLSACKTQTGSGVYATEVADSTVQSNSIYGSSETTCENNPLAVITAQTDCDEFDVLKLAGAYKIGDECIELTVSSHRDACIIAQGRLSGVVSIFDDDDSTCQLQAILNVRKDSDCSKISNREKPGSIFTDGKCIAVTDKSRRDICNEFKGS